MADKAYARQTAIGLQDVESQEMETPKDYFENLTERAGFGDIHAMFLLGKWFRDRLSDTYLKLEAEWEETPDEIQKKFSDYTTKNKDDALNASAGTMWLIRAAVYGNAQAAELVSKHEHWNRISLLPETFFYPGTKLQLRISGEKLRHAGLLDFTENQSYNMESMDENGVFRAKTDAGYDGPDADGYGMEEFYNFYHFDEFFHNIGSLQEYSKREYKNGRARFADKWTEQKIAYQQQREDYWAGKQLPEGSEQYKYLTSTYRGALIQNGILKHYGEERKITYAIPQTVTRIAAKAFNGNSCLQEIIVPESVWCIEAEAFSCCESLKKLHLPEHLTVLGANLCYNSRSLEEIHLPEQLMELPENMFKFNKSMKQLKLPGNLKKIQKGCFSYSDIPRISLPEGLEEIGSSAFESCDKLKSVKLPASLKQIGAEAFSGCEKLWKVTIPASVEKIGYDAFPKKIIICGKAGTEAERYAKKNKCLFIRKR